MQKVGSLIEEAINRTPFPAPYCLRHFQIFDKIDSFPKKILNVFRIIKGKWHLARTAWFIFNCFANQFLSFSLLQQKIELSWRNYLFELQNQDGHCTTNKQTNCTSLFIRNCNNASGILDWPWILHYFWLQEFIQKQT